MRGKIEKRESQLLHKVTKGERAGGQRGQIGNKERERCSDTIRAGKVCIWTRLPENARPAHAFGQRALGVEGTRC